MVSLRLLCSACLMGCLLIGGRVDPVHAQDEAAQPVLIEQEAGNPVKASLLSETQSIQPGGSFWVAVRLEIADQWHAYWKNPGSAGMAPQIEWSLPEGFKVEQLQWPTPKRSSLASAVSFGYEKELVLLAEISAPKSYQNSSAEIKADMRWVVCSDSNCLPGDAQLMLKLPVNQQTPAFAPSQIQLFRQARQQIPQRALSGTAERKEGLIQLNFNAPAALQNVQITGADFFSEKPHAVNEAQPVMLQPGAPAGATGNYTVVLQEKEPNSVIQGILVLQTAEGAHAYELNLPIAGSKDAAEEQRTIVEADKPVLASHATSSEKQADAFAFEGGLPFALLFAFVGGLMLNLMPCVLPVISFKILEFVKLAGENRRLIFQHGLVFAGGVLVSFWVLAALLMLLQSYGHAVGWGFQLQQPLFVAVLAAFLFLFGLSLFGMFEIGTSLIAAGSQAQQAGVRRSALVGSFLSGVLATVVATPCTGPFLGSAVGFAFTLPPLQTLLIFTSIGVGMAAPYLALAAFPTLLRFMPKAGAWMVTFKELMGFFMMATVLWLLWVFAAETNLLALNLLLVGLFFLALAGWVYGRWCTFVRKKTVRRLGLLMAALCFAAAIYTVTLATSAEIDALGGSASASSQVHASAGWEKYSPERVAQLRSQGVPVFVDFTAKWCLICQANHLILSSKEAEMMFQKLGVVRMKADWTKNDPAITEALRQFGRNSVPLYVLYSNKNEEPRILPQVLTGEVVLNELKQLEEALQ
jgi:thiol:disulfide interchange protein/DsbC/DsbD-like thiol-disulfide interchange protein